EPLGGRAPLRLARREPSRRAGSLRAAGRPSGHGVRPRRPRARVGRVRAAGQRGGLGRRGDGGLRPGARGSPRRPRRRARRSFRRFARRGADAFSARARSPPRRRGRRGRRALVRRGGRGLGARFRGLLPVLLRSLLGRLLLALAPCLLLLLGLLLLGLLLALAAAPAGLAGVLLRRGKVVRERVRDLLDRSQPLAHAVDELLCGRRVGLCGGEQGDSNVDRLLERDVDEPGGVFLVPVTAGVRQGPEKAFRLRQIRARAAVLQLARCAGEAPRPAGEDLLRRIHLPLADRAEEDADSLNAVFLPGRRRGDHGDQVVEARAVDAYGDAVAQG